MTRYDPTDAQVLADPYPAYARLRRDAPLCRVASRDLWVLSRYEDVRAALRDHGRLSSLEGIGSDSMRVPLMITSDPPDHTRLRRAVSLAFTPRHIAAHEAHIRALIDDLFAPVLDGGVVDVAESISYEFPLRVIAALLGVPDELLPSFRRWSECTIAALSGDDADETWDTISSAFGYFVGLLGEELDPDSLVGTLAAQVPDQLQDFEFASFCILLLVAGTETTANFVGNSLLALHDHRDQWEALRDGTVDLGDAVEELLRYDAPIQGFVRTATEAIPMHGMEIPSGGRVLLLFASANHDDALTADAGRLDLTRGPVPHLAFGAGIHTCLGASLARLEASLLYERLRSTLRGFEIVGPVTRTANPYLRGVVRLPMEFAPA